MKFTDEFKLFDEQRHQLLVLVTESYLDGCTCEVRPSRKGTKTFELYIRLGQVEDLLPMPKSVEEYTRALHTFERFANKWNRRGVPVTLDSWTKKGGRPHAA